VQNGVLMAFAVLYLPLVTEFAAPRAEVAGVQSVALLLGGVTGPLVGWGLDRLGPRRLFPLAAAVAAAGLLWASQARSLGALTLAYGVVAGVGLSGLGSQANMTVAALWYPRARGRAIAVVDLGTGLGAFVFIPLGQALISTVGWRATLVVWALLMVGLLIPANLLQRLPPPEPRPPAPSAPAGAAARPHPGATWTLARAIRAPAFWWLALVRWLAAVGFPLMNVHMVAFAIGAGVPPVEAAAALGTVSLVSLGGRLATGWLADRLGRAATLTVAFAAAIAGIACLFLLAATGARGWLLGYVLLYGLAQGSSGIVTAARAADLFAGPHFGAVYGWLSLVVGPGEALGAWAGGALYDATGSYLSGFGLAAGALAVAAALMWAVRSPGAATSGAGQPSGST
jgi:MFS family permease